MVTRTPVLGPNLDPSRQIAVGNATDFCDFQASGGDTSRISRSLGTLYSVEPALAALACLTKPPLPKDTGGANPSAINCVQLGGADDVGTTMAGWGWAAVDPAVDQNIPNSCVFADGSMIDAWGIAYHANDIVRGVDLTPVLRCQASDYPKVWE